jgi:hypothetical protein
LTELGVCSRIDQQPFRAINSGPGSGRGGRAAQGFVVHRGGVAGTALVPGVKAVTLTELLGFTGS